MSDMYCSVFTDYISCLYLYTRRCIGGGRMTKKTLLKILEDVDDDAIIYVDVDDDIAGYHSILHIKNAVTVGDDDVQNEVTLFCW